MIFQHFYGSIQHYSIRNLIIHTTFATSKSTKEMKNYLLTYLIILVLFPLAGGCTLHEEPELTADGEVGIDPTSVSVMANITLSMKLTDYPTTQITTRANAADHRRRFIVEAYLGRSLAQRQVIYEELNNSSLVTVPLTMKLHARKYQLVVWSDYVGSTSTEDLYYNTTEMIPVLGASPYVGNTEFKDAFCASVSVDLTQYRNQWKVKVPVDIELQRPVARYELVATDVARFKKRVESNIIQGKTFTATLKYTDYLPIGYNVYDGICKQLLMYMGYKRTFTLEQLTGDEFTLAFDYIFASDKKEKAPISIELTNEKGDVVGGVRLAIPHMAGRQTILRGSYLTSKSNGGVDFDPSFDGEVDVDINVSFK